MKLNININERINNDDLSNDINTLNENIYLNVKNIPTNELVKYKPLCRENTG